MEAKKKPKHAARFDARGKRIPRTLIENGRHVRNPEWKDAKTAKEWRRIRKERKGESHG